MFRLAHTSVDFIARWTALSGGLVLIAVVVMTCVSIAGRALGGVGLPTGPIPGDFELVEMGIGFAIFAFLPWCQLNRGHARVDLFQRQLGPRTNRFIDLLSDAMMLTAAALISWRMWLGMLDKRSYHETSFILQIPVWYAYAAAMLGAIIFVVVSTYCVWRSAREVLGRADDQF